MQKLYTIEDLEQLDDPEQRYELDEGVLVEVSRPQSPHGYVQANVVFLLQNFVKPRNLGYVFVESGVVLQRGPDTLRGPDVWFVATTRIVDPLQGKYLEGAPELVIEIQSPSDSGAQMLRRVSQYLAAGTQLVWVVQPTWMEVAVYSADGPVQVLGARDTLTADPVLPGFSVVVQELFK